MPALVPTFAIVNYQHSLFWTNTPKIFSLASLAIIFFLLNTTNKYTNCIHNTRIRNHNSKWHNSVTVQTISKINVIYTYCTSWEDTSINIADLCITCIIVDFLKPIQIFVAVCIMVHYIQTIKFECVDLLCRENVGMPSTVHG